MFTQKQEEFDEQANENTVYILNDPIEIYITYQIWAKTSTHTKQQEQIYPVCTRVWIGILYSLFFH